MVAAPYEIDVDDLWPRDEEHRYRIYARRGDELEVLAATGCWAGVGQAIGQLEEDERERGRRLMDRGAFGVLDAVEGRWIVLPWHRPDGLPSFGPTRAPLEAERRRKR